MKLPRINEYDVILFAVIIWMMAQFYPSLNIQLEVGVTILYFLVPAFATVPIAWFIIRNRLNVFLKVFVILTSWYLLASTMMMVSAAFGTAGTTPGNIMIPGTVIQPLAGAALFVLLLASFRKPVLRWLNFTLLTAYWAFYVPKSFNTAWSSFDPSRFLSGDFISFVMPLILYLYIADVRTSEGATIACLRSRSNGRWGVRLFRLGHIGGYVLIIALGMFLMFDFFFLRLFNPSAYLLASLEITSPVSWSLLLLITAGMLVFIPVALMSAGQRIKRSLSKS